MIAHRTARRTSSDQVSILGENLKVKRPGRRRQFHRPGPAHCHHQQRHDRIPPGAAAPETTSGTERSGRLPRPRLRYRPRAPLEPWNLGMLRTPNVSQSPAAARTARVAWTVVSIFSVETLVFGLSGLPAFLFWTWALSWATPPLPLVRPVILAMSLVPAYLSFAITLIVLSAGTTRLFGWRTAKDGAWRLADLEWPLLDWSRYMISTHVVRVLVGTFFRSSPLWTWYMKLNGARHWRVPSTSTACPFPITTCSSSATASSSARTSTCPGILSKAAW